MEPTGNSPSAEPDKPPQFRKFPVDQIKPSRSQARKTFAEDALRDLANSMKENGQIAPINIRLLADGSAELVAGERRLRAAKLLGWTELDAIVESDVSDQAAAVKGLIENLQRKDLNPIEEAKGFFQLQEMDKKKWTHEEIGKMVGKERTYVTERLSLLNLPEALREKVERSTFSPGHADAILRLPTPEKQIEIAKRAIDGDWSVKETEKWVKQLLGNGDKTGKTAKGAPPDPYRELWLKLKDQLAACPEAWAVVYSSFTFRGKNEPGWAFGLINQEVSLKRISAWLRLLAQGIDEAHFADPLEARQNQEPNEEEKLLRQQMAWRQEQAGQIAAMIKETPAQAQENRRLNTRAAELWMPKTAEEAKEMKDGSSQVRLPQTQQEWGEVEAAAEQGPGGLYERLCGKDSYWAKKAAHLTWQDLGETDPLAACHKAVEAMRMMGDMNARPAQKAAEVPPKTSEPAAGQSEIKARDPKVAAMIARQLAKGKLR